MITVIEKEIRWIIKVFESLKEKETNKTKERKKEKKMKGKK